MTTDLNPDIAYVCPLCDGGTGMVRPDDGMIACGKCRHVWHPDYTGGDKSGVKVQVGDGIYMDFYGNEPLGIYIDTDRWLAAVGDVDDELARTLQGYYDAINGRDDHRYSYDYDVVDEFFETVPNVHREGEGGWYNTYNGECDLDTTLEILTFRACEASDDPEIPGDPEDGDHYIMVRRHMGGDVRGNYASPIILRLYEWGDQYDVTVSVDLPPLKRPQGETLDGEPAPTGDWESFELTYYFDDWLEKNDLQLDLLSTRRGVPRLTNGRQVYFSSSPMMNG